MFNKLLFNCKQIPLILFMVMVTQFVIGQIKPLLFERINNEQGLSQNTIIETIQDKNGFIWIATQDGLNRHDGYSFKIFKNKSDNENSISNNMIRDISFDSDRKKLWVASQQGIDILDVDDFTIERFESYNGNTYELPDNAVECILHDSNKRVWIGTTEGLGVFDLATEKIFTFTNDLSSITSISNNYINCLYEDGTGNIWIGTSSGLNKVLGSVSSILDVKRYSDGYLSNNFINAIYADSNGNIWVGTENGLNIIDPLTEEVIAIYHDSENKHSLSDDRITAIFEDSNNNIWIGTKKGLNRLKYSDISNPQFDKFFKQASDKFSLGDNWVNSIFEDQAGVLWIGTYFGGISKLRINDKQFYTFRNYADNANSLTSSVIRSISMDYKNEMLWVGTNPGLNKINLSSGRITRFLQDTSNNSLSNDIIRSLCLDENGKLWIGTGRGGLNIYDPVSNEFSYITHDSSNVQGFKGRDVRTIIQDSKGYIWAGTNKSGLNRINPKNGEVVNFSPDRFDPYSIGSKYIDHLVEDSLSNIWIATFDGLDYYNRENNQFTHYRKDVNNPNSIPVNYIKSILLTKKGQIWLGSGGGGIYHLADKEKGVFKTYSTKNGLVNNFIYGLLEDQKGNIWASTNQGLARLNPESEKIIVFDKDDGIQEDEFNTGAFYGSKEGNELYFGGVNGLTYFNPDSIKFNTHKPHIAITDIQVFNKSIFDRSNKELNHILSTWNNDSLLSLTYRENVISFEFAALDFSSPLKNRYAYKMEGFDKEWIFTDAKKRFTTYTNLAAGNYAFLIRGSNNDRVWSDEIYKLNIKITPPFYREKWFVFVFILTIVSLVYTFHRSRLALLNKQKNRLTEEVENQTMEIKRKNKQLKIRQTEILKQNEELGIQAKELKTKSSENQILYELSSNLIAPIELDILLKSIVEAAVALIPNAQDSSIFLLNDDILEGKVSFEFPDEQIKKLRFKIGEGQSGKAVAERKSFIENNLVEDNIVQHQLLDFNIKPIKSIIVVLLKEKQKIIGAISLDNHSRNNAFSEKDMEILSSLAANASVAIERVRIHEEIEIVNDNLSRAYTKLKDLDNYKESMTAMIIHDFKNALNTVISFSEGTPTERRLKSIRQAGQFMLNMALNILDVQKFENTEVKWAPSNNPVSKVINEAMNQLNYMIEQKSIKLSYDLDQSFICRFDFDLTTRVIVNILSNAIKYVTINGHVSISTKLKDGFVLTSIQDDGPGIPKDKIHMVFDKFSQINAQKSGSVRSTGIGLTFCKMVIEAQGGEIGVDSKEGHGSNFYFTLPLVDQNNVIKVSEEKIDQNLQKNKTFELLEYEKELLKPYFTELQNWEVYDYSEVTAIVEKIKEKSKNINVWKELMLKAIQNVNEEHFNKLLNR